jgi:hypothetical protein
MKIFPVIAFCVTMSLMGCSSNRDKWKETYGAPYGWYSNGTNSGIYSNRTNSRGDFLGTNSGVSNGQRHSYRTQKVPGPLPVVGLIGMCYFAYKLKNRNGNK